MSEPLEQFDRVFHQAVVRAYGGSRPDGVPFADILRGACVGFDLGFGSRLMTEHSWLAFLNRLWDSQRVDGLPVGPIRVPKAIWELAERGDAVGRLHQQLLETTGLRLPRDFGQQLEFHLTLWDLVSVMRADGTATEHSVCCDGPVRLAIRQLRDGVEVEVSTDVAGRFEVELHWPDGDALAFRTAELARGQIASYSVRTRSDTLPTSTSIRRLSETS